MKRAYTNGILLDGTEQMQPEAHKILLTEDDKIIAIVDEGVDLDGYEVIDLHGGYLCPGLINQHVHLAGNGKPSAKPRDNAALVRKNSEQRPDPCGSLQAGVQLRKAGAAGWRDYHPYRGRHFGFRHPMP